MNKIVYCYNLILEKKPIVLALSFFYDFIQIIIIANQRFPCAVGVFLFGRRIQKILRKSKFTSSKSTVETPEQCLTFAES